MECPILLACDTTENWEKSGVVLGDSELAIEIFTQKDGTTHKRLLVGDGKPAGPGAERLRARPEFFTGLPEEWYDKLEIAGKELKAALINDFKEKIAAVTALEPATHAEMLAAISANGLIPGTAYLITDFQTIYKQPVTGIVMAGGIEPLAVTAISGNALAPAAFSPSRPRDVIWYDIRQNSTGRYEWAAPGDRGQIYRRITEHGNDIPFDVRAVRFRRWHDPATGEFTGLSDTGGGYQDLYLFDYDYNGNSVDLNGVYGNKIRACSYSAVQRLNNSVFTKETSNNTFGCGFYGNTVLNRLFDNRTGSGFMGNIITPDTYYGGVAGNAIGNDFWHNTIGHGFEGNTVGNGFQNNKIGEYFQGNTVGNSVRSNRLGDGYSNNRFGDGFQNQIMDIGGVRHNEFGNGIKQYKVWPSEEGGFIEGLLASGHTVRFSASAYFGTVGYAYIPDSMGYEQTGIF